jgi:NADPH2:quinone reductase
MFTRPRFQCADMAEQGKILERVARLVERGELRSTLSRCFEPIAVETLQQAHELLRRGRTLGKLALRGWDGG